MLAPEFATRVVVNLVGEETGAVAATETAEAVSETTPPITEEKAEEESEDTSTPTSKVVTEAAVIHGEPRRDTAHTILVGRVNNSRRFCHNNNF